jgi:hypothetical protein
MPINTTSSITAVRRGAIVRTEGFLGQAFNFQSVFGLGGGFA